MREHAEGDPNERAQRGLRDGGEPGRDHGVRDWAKLRPGGNGDYATVAYGAATGKQLWVSRYNGPANLGDHACCVAVSPAGAKVFATGDSYNLTPGADYVTVAYRG